MKTTVSHLTCFHVPPDALWERVPKTASEIKLLEAGIKKWDFSATETWLWTSMASLWMEQHLES